MHLILRVFGARERPVKVEIKLFAFYIYNRRLEANICIKYLDPAGLSGHGLRFALVSISSCGITCELARLEATTVAVKDDNSGNRRNTVSGEGMNDNLGQKVPEHFGCPQLDKFFDFPGCEGEYPPKGFFAGLTTEIG
ncbi:hypothetical protein SUGI_0238850 [Cryptomeria japonica]|nr:hypothetical protein SUGI_0238850 [Cryptomeria japonica]